MSKKDKKAYMMQPHNFELALQEKHAAHKNYNGWEKQLLTMNDNDVNDISDPNLDNTSDEITSIPSPFARIDIMQKAFEEVCRLGLSGSTKYHKMVSFCLDVAQMFYSYNSLIGDLEIIKWDKNADLLKLHNTSSGTEKFARTLDLFLAQDASTYNFDRMNSIYLLRYKNPNNPNTYEIIGATSPTTLFFTSANSYNVDISFTDKNGQPHQVLRADKILPLSERNDEFRMFMYSLQNGFNQFYQDFKAIDEYITLCKNKDNVQIPAWGTYTPVTLKDHTQVMILNNVLHGKTLTPPSTSDFTIKPTVTVSESLPLVFPCEDSVRYQNYKYLGNAWGNRIMNEHNVDDIHNRHLPNSGEIYPYLLKSDLLCDTLYVERFTVLDSDRFCDGGLKLIGQNKNLYLLPVKPIYFKYFTRKDFESNFKMREIQLPDKTINVETELRIPVNGGEIVYHRVYSAENILQLNFNLAIVSPIEQVDKTVCFNNNQGGMNLDISFYKNGEQLIDVPKSQERNENYTVYSTKDFDCITFNVNNSRDAGMLLPKFRKISNSSRYYNFSIDLGTTNTHIAYAQAGTGAVNVEYMTAKDVDSQIWIIADGTNIEGKNNIREYIFPECITDGIPNDSFEVRFPIRTVLISRNNFNWGVLQAKVFADACIPFFYGSHGTEDWKDNLDINLKWNNANDPMGQAKLKAFIEVIMLMIRNKVVMLGGNLSATNITWHYPLSMDVLRRNNLTAYYSSLYEQYFGKNTANIKAKTESQSPFDYYKQKDPNGRPNLITIDIGGGTTDVTLADNNNIQYVTSFKFAANSLFETTGAFAGMSPILDIFYTNGIKHILDQVTKDKPVLNKAKQQFEKSNNSTELATFLLTLPERPEIKKGGVADISLISAIQNDSRFTLIFAVFYGAIIYHIAKIMKLKNLPQPQFIALSGNGSRVLKVFDDITLAKFSNKILEKVYGTMGKDIQILTTSEPKGATVYGGLLSTPIANLNDKQIVYITDNVISDIDHSPLFKDINNSNVREEIINDVNVFWDDIFDIFNDNWKGLTTDLGIALNLNKDLLGKIKTTVKGITSNYVNIPNNQDTVEDTFFFDPIRGALVRITENISSFIKGNN